MKVKYLIKKNLLSPSSTEKNKQLNVICLQYLFYARLLKKLTIVRFKVT